MKYIYNRKLFISVMFILLVICNVILPCSDFPILINFDKIPSIQFHDETPSLKLDEENFNGVSIMLPRAQYKLKYNANSNSSIFEIIETSKFVLALQFALQLLVFDRRKQIIALIISHFEGGKYKSSLSL
ncbi:MAG TPA: hypothetical protein PKU88_11475 [Bacillota bacterium]|nr:hypothetical protein [Clostridiaceae bacterium]HNR05272.1 hypothetical protein [Bacillota bacterium]HNT04107.1 hypothetical protein [Bacillota bacterium]HNU80725.1 hypothetical protein [Bacillota bacterium]HPW41631.1 hypothetical protein [Bacillota bacterium]